MIPGCRFSNQTVVFLLDPNIPSSFVGCAQSSVLLFAFRVVKCEVVTLDMDAPASIWSCM